MKDHITIGMDLGDRSHVAVAFNAKGDEISISRVVNTRAAIVRFIKSYDEPTVAIEAGTHSPWISRCLQELGCTVYVGNPRQLRFIWDAHDKSDERDARLLAMVCRIEPRLLKPIQHRSARAHADLEQVKARDMLVKTRSQLINHVRGVVKTLGERLPKCSAESFAKRCCREIPLCLQEAVAPLLETITDVTDRIRAIDRRIEQISVERYPEAQRLREVPGVGPITALAYVLTIEDPRRFAKSRQLGAYLGLTPRRDQSGEIDKQLRISKAGNRYLRKLLVSCAHYTLGPFAPDSDLRRFGLAIEARGGKYSKKRAVVAVARKLSVLLHRLWVDDCAYQPFYRSKYRKAA